MVNPLNYIYLDLAYMQYPVLHNAPMCKDIGYYYEDCDTIGGAKQLETILTQHDQNLDEYNHRNRQAIRRYESDNPELIATYDRLIDNLYNGKGNRGLVYDPMTNNYTN